MTTQLMVLLALLLSHVLGDFVLQRTDVVIGRQRGAVWASAEHGGWHLAALLFCLGTFAPEVLNRGMSFVILGSLVVAHLGVDRAKSMMKGSCAATMLFVLDQAAHLVVLSCAWMLLIGAPVAAAWLETSWVAAAPRVLVVALGYLLVLPAAGYLNAVALAPLADRIERRAGEGPDPGLARAGLYIGWLERFLILTAVLARSPTAVGLVVAAKSVFRFEDVRHGRRAAEYFLIGTLLSVSEAVVVGLGVLAILGG